MGQVGQSKRKNAIFALLLLSGSLFLSALAAEVILRMLGHHGAPLLSISNIYPVNDPVLDWRYVPNSETRLGRVIYKYNKSGFRDVDHLVEKPPRITRIVVVGDSVTEGAGVEWESVFSHILQSKLSRDFEVITLAAGGLNTPQEVHLFEQEGLLYKPDLVILNFVLNDCDFYTSLKDGHGQRYVDKQDSKIGLLFDLPINPHIKRTLKSSALVYFLKERLEDLKGRLLGDDNTDYYSRIWSSDANRGKVTDGFDKLKVLQDQHNLNVVVIIWPVITDYRNYGFQSVHQWVEEQAKKRGFSTIDLLGSFSKLQYRDLQLTAEDNVHPNALGHEIGAEAFVKWYRTNGVSTR